MATDYRIEINFLPLAGEIPAFKVFRKPRQAEEARPSDDAMGFSLPVRSDAKDRASFWVQFISGDGFEEFTAHSEDNRYLTRRTLFYALCESAANNRSADQFHVPRGGFGEELYLFMEQHQEGQEALTIQPYLLRATSLLGWLVDFHFFLRDGVAFSRRVQQLSLSLDRNYRRNLDYYLDRSTKIQTFLDRNRDIFDSIALPGNAEVIETGRSFVSLPAQRLATKIYLCGGNRESRSQFNGLRRFGPLQPITETPTLLFAFRERDRQAARTLALGLRGSSKRERFNFPGFHSLFKTDPTISPDPIVLPDLSHQSFHQARTSQE